jgi:glycosyltransferase involved in cell wall biosynthesis
MRGHSGQAQHGDIPSDSVAFVIPAHNEGPRIATVIRGVREAWPGSESPPIVVVDDGSTDDTADAARDVGATVISHEANCGKGAALRTGFAHAVRMGAEVAVTLDADGQHPTDEAVRLALDPSPKDALVLGVRDLSAAGAPVANQISNRISNFFLSAFTLKRLADTQCGMRRYPIAKTVALGVGGRGFSFESEVILRASRAGWQIVQRGVGVVYPADRTSHFHSVRDPARIVSRISWTLLDPTSFFRRG